MTKDRQEEVSRRDFLRLGVTVGCGLVVPPMLAGCLSGDGGGDDGPVETFVEPKVIRSIDGMLDVTLTVSYVTTTINGVAVKLRSYGEIPGPTLVVNVGDTLRIKLVNQLPPNPYDPEPTEHLRYHNNTNLHTHGLHVFPGVYTEGMPGLYGDYVMDESNAGVQPGQTRQYEYHLREDHPTGMFWYHPHVHGSTAMQVGSWMAGALIVKGAIDRIPEMAVVKERVFVLQAPIYDDTTGQLESFAQVANNPSGNAHPWKINGVSVPRIVMHSGEVQNWRLLNAGIFNLLNLSLDGHTLYLHGLDGNPMADYRPSPPVPVPPPGATTYPSGIVLAPGNRASVLVKALAPGTYYLRTMQIQMGTPNNVLPSSILAEVVVVESRWSMQLPKPPLPVTAFLAPITDEELAAHGGMKRSIVMRAISNPWPGTPNPPPSPFPITDAPANQIVHPGSELDDWVYNTGPTSVANSVYALGSPSTAASPNPVQPPTVFTNPSEYIPFQSVRRITQRVALDSVEEWTVFNMNNIRHPFHIHVNPMYVVAVNGKKLIEPYWADTVALPPGGSVTQPTSITFRTRFLHYTGPYVMHCHMLSHEDMGMMQGVTVS